MVEIKATLVDDPVETEITIGPTEIEIVTRENIEGDKYPNRLGRVVMTWPQFDAVLAWLPNWRHLVEGKPDA